VAPADELLGDSLISFLGTTVYCGFYQSACAMVLPPIWAAVAGVGDPCWWGFLELSVHRVWGPECNFFFLLRPFV